MSDKQYIASLSYGKDSMAMLHVVVDVLHWPLDRIITADVWATPTISADLPPMVEFKKKADAIIKERWGIEVEHFCAKMNGKPNNYERQFYTKVGEKRQEARKCMEGKTCHRCEGMQDIYGFPLTHGAWCNSKLKMDAINQSKKTFEDVFYHVRGKGKRVGQIVGFPMTGHNECNSELKRPVFNQIKKECKGAIQYIGIASDEPLRIERHQKKEGILMPLVEAGWTEQMCIDWCRKEGVLSPTYETSFRDGCWFCHNQGLQQLRLLRKNYPELWQLLLKWDSDSPVTFKSDGKTVHDYDERFQWEDDGYKPTGKQFRWEDVKYQQMNIEQFLE